MDRKAINFGAKQRLLRRQSETGNLDTSMQTTLRVKKFGRKFATIGRGLTKSGISSRCVTTICQQSTNSSLSYHHNKTERDPESAILLIATTSNPPRSIPGREPASATSRKALPSIANQGQPGLSTQHAKGFQKASSELGNNVGMLSQGSQVPHAYRATINRPIIETKQPWHSNPVTRSSSRQPAARMEGLSAVRAQASFTDRLTQAQNQSRTAHPRELKQNPYSDDCSGGRNRKGQAEATSGWPPSQEEFGEGLGSFSKEHLELWSSKDSYRAHKRVPLPDAVTSSSLASAGSPPKVETPEADEQLRSDRDSQHEAHVPREFQFRADDCEPKGRHQLQSFGDSEPPLRPSLGVDAEAVAETTSTENLEGSGDLDELAELKASIMAEVMPDVHVVDTPEEAHRIAKLLLTKYKYQTFACDTEVAFIDVKKQSPCGHGKVICFSVYGGENVDFGQGPLRDRCRKTQLWVNTYFGNSNQELTEEEMAAATGKAKAILDEFKPFFTRPDIRKVWHNYSFDRHVLANMDIHCQGFAGDTMHMARLLDSSRKGTRNYSLANLTGDKAVMMSFHGESRGKISMKELFGKKNITKDGKEGKLFKIPSMEELHSSEDTRAGWINYSAFDAKATHQLYSSLSQQLSTTPCTQDPAISKALGITRYTMLDFYEHYWRPFGLLLTDMEKEGILVNRGLLEEAQVRAGEDHKAAQNTFRDWAKRIVPDAEFMNVGSTNQIQQLFYPGLRNNKDTVREELPPERVFQAPNVKGIIKEGAKKPKKNMDIMLWGLWGRGKDSRLTPEVFTGNGWPAVSTPVLRALAGKPGVAKKALAEIIGDNPNVDSEPSLSDVASYAEEAEDMDDGPIWATDNSQIIADKLKRMGRLTGCPAPPDRLQQEADASGFGKMYAAFDGGISGLEACTAVDSLCELGAIESMLSNFIEPLQQDDIATRDADGNLGRIHCSLNINTETGRLSARRPNLQNQPALEKDRYKVRKAFTADVSKRHHLVVADYGQLELRLLAHMTNCQSMLTAFKVGGDFHSRTALGMYDHIKEAIAKEQCLLEWDGPQGTKAPVPLLKDMFASERRKAKILNFSIAYGKTAHGLSKDWKVDLQEAQDTVDRWYSDRPEVLEWQKAQRKHAEERGFVTTMLGRRRYLPDAMGTNSKAKGHALRAAINTPIQGSAADVATAAMICIARCPQLENLGWKLLLQVHDEVILEGPEESAAEAKRLVVDHMGKPFNGKNPLLVDLNVDAKTAATWYEAK